MGVDHCGDGIGGVVKSVDELESQRYQQSKAKQEIRQNRSVVDTRQIRRQAGAGIYDTDDQHHSEGKNSDLPGTLAELGVERRHRYWLQLWGWRR